MIYLRRISQIVFLLLFIVLLFLTTSKAVGAFYNADQHFILRWIPVNLFFIADPLLALSAVFAAKTVLVPFIAALVVVIATILLGRVFCGWICPLGSTMDIFNRIKSRAIDPDWKTSNKSFKKIKYILLVFILAAAMFGANIAGWFDPITIAFRAFALVLYPALDYLAKRLFDGIGATGVVTKLGDWGITDPNPVSFHGALIFLLVFAMIIFSIFYRTRFWCRYICPLGALLGILSKWSLLRLNIGSGCNQCNKCQAVCKTGCLGKNLTLEKEECIQCYTCTHKCAENTLSINFGRNTLPNDKILPSRRGFILTAGLSILAIPLLRRNITGRRNYNPLPRLRPPGGLRPDEEFLKRCSRCGECMKVCPTNGLQPLLTESGFYSMWTPTLIPRIGQCAYYCNACGQVCPTGAIKPLQLEDKQEYKMGLAYFDTTRCIPYVSKERCVTCHEFCPLPEKAIELEEKDGIPYPYIVKERCIGCGMCEKVCPVPGLAAIRVHPIKENGNT